MAKIVIAIVGVALAAFGAFDTYTSSPEKKLNGIGIALFGLAQVGFAIFLSLP